MVLVSWLISFFRAAFAALLANKPLLASASCISGIIYGIMLENVQEDSGVFWFSMQAVGMSVALLVVAFKPQFFPRRLWWAHAISGAIQLTLIYCETQAAKTLPLNTFLFVVGLGFITVPVALWFWEGNKPRALRSADWRPPTISWLAVGVGVAATVIFLGPTLKPHDLPWCAAIVALYCLMDLGRSIISDDFGVPDGEQYVGTTLALAWLSIVPFGFWAMTGGWNETAFWQGAFTGLHNALIDSVGVAIAGFAFPMAIAYGQPFVEASLRWAMVCLGSPAWSLWLMHWMGLTSWGQGLVPLQQLAFGLLALASGLELDAAYWGASLRFAARRFTGLALQLSLWAGRMEQTELRARRPRRRPPIVRDNDENGDNGNNAN